MSKSKEEKRNRILAAAIHVFAKKGFFHAKISEIAKEAGVADGTIYLYFKNKDHLLIAVFEEKMDEIIKDITAAVDEVDDVRLRHRAADGSELLPDGQVLPKEAEANVFQIRHGSVVSRFLEFQGLVVDQRAGCRHLLDRVIVIAELAQHLAPMLAEAGRVAADRGRRFPEARARGQAGLRRGLRRRLALLAAQRPERLREGSGASRNEPARPRDARARALPEPGERRGARNELRGSVPVVSRIPDVLPDR